MNIHEGKGYMNFKKSISHYRRDFVGLFDLIIYVPVNNFFSYVVTGLPGLNQYYKARQNSFSICCKILTVTSKHSTTVLPAKSDSDIMNCFVYNCK